MTAPLDRPGDDEDAAHDAAVAGDLRGHYAGFVSRAVAFVIDLVLVSIGVAATLWIVALVFDVFDVQAANTVAGKALVVVSVPFALIVYCGVAWSVLGKTVGMLTMGLRVVKADGHVPGLARSLLRAWAYFISAIFFLGFLWVLIDRRRQGWHDKIARTFVVYDWEARAGERLLRPDLEVLVPRG